MSFITKLKLTKKNKCKIQISVNTNVKMKNVQYLAAFSYIFLSERALIITCLFLHMH